MPLKKPLLIAKTRGVAGDPAMIRLKYGIHDTLTLEIHHETNSPSFFTDSLFGSIMRLFFRWD